MPNLDPINDRLCVIAESDPFLARLLQRFAEKSGLGIQHARTGEDVLELAKRRPGLIIIDPELPGKVRGWDAVKAIRAGSLTSSIPVIICSWLKKPEALALVGQISAYLQKPDLSYEDFVKAIKEAGMEIPHQPGRP
jgi:DNA-binding response OmpR family regulator